jgi:membrane protein
MKFVIDSYKILHKAGILFFEKHGLTLASSSSFFAIITSVPFFLLIIRGIGYFLGSLSHIQKYLFILGQRFFPEMAPQLLLQVQAMIKGPLFADQHFTILNFIFLVISAITFLNSIWMGIFFITEDRKILSVKKHLKGFVIIAITLLILGMVFVIPPIIIYIIKFIQTNLITQFFFDNFDFLRPLLTYVKTINLKKSYWLHSNVLHITIVLLYFTLLYRWLFSWKISLREAFIASLSFSLSVFIGKYLFWIYIYYVRDGMINNYGDFYTSILGLIWLFYLMCFFFYGACVCQVYNQLRLHKLEEGTYDGH